MPGGYEINEYQLPLDFTEEERERFNNVGFSDEFKRQILTQKEGGWGMVGTWKVTNRTKDGVAYTKIPVNESNMVDVGECYTGRIIDRLAEYEDSGLSPDEVQELAKAKAEGRLVVLPCKVGDTAYEIVDSVDIPYVKQEKVIAIELWNKNGAMTMFIRTPYGLFEFDKTVFLTREAAEKVLPTCNVTKLPCAWCNPVCEHRAKS